MLNFANQLATMWLNIGLPLKLLAAKLSKNFYAILQVNADVSKSSLSEALARFQSFWPTLGKFDRIGEASGTIRF